MSGKEFKALLYFPMPRPDWLVPNSIVKNLIESYPEVNFIFTTEEEIFIKEIKNADIIFSPSILDEWYLKTENLKWFQSSSIQFVVKPMPELLKSDVIITNAKGAHQTVVSERALGSTLYFLHNLMPSGALVSHLATTKSLDGRVIGIVGLGENGTALGLRANLMGAKVIATKRTQIEIPPFALNLSGPEGLYDMAKEVDVLYITCPLTSETENIISEEIIFEMKTGSIIINAGRPNIVEEKSIHKALTEGKILGYAVDSLLPKESVLYSTDNVLVVPHITPSHVGFWNGPFHIFADNLDKFIEGVPLRNTFNRELLY